MLDLKETTPLVGVGGLAVVSIAVTRGAIPDGDDEVFGACGVTTSDGAEAPVTVTVMSAGSIQAMLDIRCRVYVPGAVGVKLAVMDRALSLIQELPTKDWAPFGAVICTHILSSKFESAAFVYWIE